VKRPATVGPARPVGDRSRFAIGYLGRYLEVPGREDRWNHLLSVSLQQRF
jgi:hypothetical protein